MASAEVYRTGRSARIDAMDLARAAHELGVVSSVRRLQSSSRPPLGCREPRVHDDRLPPDAEERLMKFTDLVATAIANAESKSALAASRRRIVAASDESRRRIERDIHDGTQQRLVTRPGIALRRGEGPRRREELRDELSHVWRGLSEAVGGLAGDRAGSTHNPHEGGSAQPCEHSPPVRRFPSSSTLTTTCAAGQPIKVAAYSSPPRPRRLQPTFEASRIDLPWQSATAGCCCPSVQPQDGVQHEHRQIRQHARWLLDGPELRYDRDWNTATVEIISSASLNNDEIWLEVEYLGTASSSLASFRNSLPATGADHTGCGHDLHRDMEQQPVDTSEAEAAGCLHTADRRPRALPGAVG